MKNEWTLKSFKIFCSSDLEVFEVFIGVVVGFEPKEMCNSVRHTSGHYLYNIDEMIDRLYLFLTQILFYFFTESQSYEVRRWIDDPQW